MEFDIDTTELTKMANSYTGGQAIVRQELGKGLLRAANVVRNLAVQLVRVRTGRLRARIAIDPVKASGDGLSVVVGTNVTYAPIVELGSGPHVIEPVTKLALYWEGAAHPVRRVNHPGTKPYPFLKPALQRSTGQISSLMSQAVAAAMTRIGSGGR